MKRRIFRLVIAAIVLLTAILAAYIFAASYLYDSRDSGRAVIAWNETGKLLEDAIEENDTSMLPTIRDKMLQQRDVMQKQGENSLQGEEPVIWPIALAVGVCAIFIVIMMGYVYFAILKPFDRMKVFAANIAAGNFEMPLYYDRANYFGEFTWAFDSMRREVTKARAMEKEAVENNKVVIASLSHDIKTPIASIMTYAEGLEASLDNIGNRELYLNVIMRKCAEVAALTDDLLLHSIADLEKLKVEAVRLELGSCIQDAVSELKAEKNDIYYERPAGGIYVMADSRRLLQVMENLVGNARKYAQTDIYVTVEADADMAAVKVRDKGTGINDGDIPFIFDKFYRGSNCTDKPGAGLGLYIVRYIMLQLRGEVMLHNYSGGLEVILKLPVVQG